MEACNQIGSKSERGKVGAVSGSVLSSFFEELSRVDDFGECAERLRKLLLVDSVFAEPAVRNALFPDSL